MEEILESLESERQKEAVLRLKEKYNLFLRKSPVRNPDIEIREGKIVGLTLKDKNINHIPDEIQKLDSLEYLDLSINNINMLSGLSDLKALRTLKLGGNQIFDIKPLASLTELKYLELGRNMIADLEHLRELKKLKELNLMGNQITMMRYLMNLRNLEILHLDLNEITEISGLQGLSKLKVLTLKGNQIKIIEGLDTLVGLRELDLSQNLIEKLEGLEKLKNLEEFDINGNPLSEADLELIKEKNSKEIIELCRIRSSLSINRKKIINFIGYSKSGKTSSIENLVAWLKRDSKLQCSVSVIKNISHNDFTIDTKGKNTYRFAEAGADVVIARSKNESAIIYKFERDVNDLIDEIDGELEKYAETITDDIDDYQKIYILEGFRNFYGPTILAVKSESEIDEQMSDNIICLTGSVGNNQEELEMISKKYKIPYIDCMHEPKKLFELIFGEF